MDCPLMNKCKKYSKLYDKGGNQEYIDGELQINIVDCAWAHFKPIKHYALGTIYECINWEKMDEKIKSDN